MREYWVIADASSRKVKRVANWPAPANPPDELSFVILLEDSDDVHVNPGLYVISQDDVSVEEDLELVRESHRAELRQSSPVTRMYGAYAVGPVIFELVGSIVDYLLAQQPVDMDPARQKGIKVMESFQVFVGAARVAEYLLRDKEVELDAAVTIAQVRAVVAPVYDAANLNIDIQQVLETREAP